MVVEYKTGRAGGTIASPFEQSATSPPKGIVTSDQVVSYAVVAAVLYQGLVVAAFCFVTWTNLLRRYSASKMTAFHFTTPIFGVLLSRLILGENILPGLAAGVALVAIGIYVVSRPEGTNRQ